jgi:predicted Rossmann fold flavoprotein
LFCAAEAGRRGRKVAVLEAGPEPGRKILISGGGRCNFTNLQAGPENFISANPHFARSALARYGPSDFLDLVRRYRIPWHEKKLGQLFCDRSARDILDMLLTEVRETGGRVFTGCRISAVRRTTGFEVETSQGEFRASALVVAAGGLSIPKIGATGFGYDLARQFGHRIEPTRPALVPFVLSDSDRQSWCDLAGVALDARASVGRQNFDERVLVTHRGLSGPAVLQISSYWDGRGPVAFDLLPGGVVEPRGNRSWKSMLSTLLPRRFAERWLEVHFETAGRQVTAAALEAGLHRWELVPAGTEGYSKAEVTAGGVSTDGLSSRTMESRTVPGLYFIGEVVDVTGHLGGFNFQWAWASAWSARQAL